MAGATNWWQYSIWQGFKWTWSNLTGHSGVDIGAPCGTVITSPVNGTVIDAGMHPWGGQIDVLTNIPGYGQVVLSWLHTSEEDVTSGPVVAGQAIGKSGQPPPGAGYGSGCHIHFEMTQGNQSPYINSPSPQHATAAEHPIDPTGFLSTLGSSGTVLGTTVGQASATAIAQACGTAPDPNNYVGGKLNPQWLVLQAQYNACVLAVNSGVGQTVVSAATTWSDVAAALGSWLTNPLRVVKLVAGLLLIGAAAFGAFASSSGGQNVIKQTARALA